VLGGIASDCAAPLLIEVVAVLQRDLA
jgi:hypothetical protein